MSVKQFIPAVKYGNAITSDEVDMSGATGDVTFTAGSPVAGTQSVTALNPAIGQTAVVSLTAAQIIAMYGAPVSLIAAPGAGKVIVIESAIVSYTPTTTSFTSGGVIELMYNSSASTAASGTIPVTVVSTSTAGVTTPFQILGVANTSVSSPIVANAAVVVTNLTGAFAGGTGTMKVTANYYIITI